MTPVPSHDCGGVPYEVTLDLRRNGDAFGSVGERCGFFLAAVARRLAEARADGSSQARGWPDPDDRFPEPGSPHREPELFAFRYRERTDLASTGELRCSLRTSSVWLPLHGWRLARRAVVEAWGAGGRGVRAVLTSTDLAAFLDDLLREVDEAGVDLWATWRDLPGKAPPARSRR